MDSVGVYGFSIPEHQLFAVEQRPCSNDARCTHMYLRAYCTECGYEWSVEHVCGDECVRHEIIKRTMPLAVADGHDMHPRRRRPPRA